MAANITGIKELNAKFQKINTTLSKKVGLKMVASAAGVIKKEAKSNAQRLGLKLSGSLIKNIVTKRDRKAPANTVQYNVGVRHGREFGKKKNVVKYLARSNKGRVVTRYKDDPFYWMFPEFGTKHQKATPYISPALVSKRQEAINAMEKILDKEILKAKL